MSKASEAAAEYVGENEQAFERSAFLAGAKWHQEQAEAMKHKATQYAPLMVVNIADLRKLFSEEK